MTRHFLSRRTFLVFAGSAAALPLLSRTQAPGSLQDPVETRTLDQLRSDLAEGRRRCQDVVARLLARIETLDRHGPTLRSVLESNPDAMALAAQLDAVFSANGPSGPLHGIPILLKDNIDTADRMKTTAGSRALMEAPAPRVDAPVVERLRAAGAVILGKTNLSEWANFRSTRSTSGWSARGGQTRNPWALDRNPSGSSSGSAVAVAAGLAPAAIGTETDGSITSPASVCGIVGLKPTVGLVSRTGIIPIAHSQDTAGPMTRTVRDAALLLNVLMGRDPHDRATAEAPEGPLDYTAALANRRLDGLRLGAMIQHRGQHPEVDALFQVALDRLKALGAVCVDVTHTSGPYEADELEVLLHEFKAGLTAYLARRGGPIQDLAALMAFNQTHRAQEMPYFGQELLEQAATRGPLTAPAYLKALERCQRLARREGLEALLQTHRLDALVAPTGTPAWLTDPINGDHPGFSAGTLAAVAGSPHLTVPMGRVHGLPVGLSILGPHWSEALLLRIGHAFEQASPPHPRPTFPATLPL